MIVRFYSRVGKIRYGTMASVMKYKGQSLCAKLEFPGLRQNIAPEAPSLFAQCSNYKY